MKKITEAQAVGEDLSKMTVSTLLETINKADHTVATAVANAIPQITVLAEKITTQLELGGRLFYIGAGTSGRLGILDASECPPTFGVPHDMVIGIIAGGDEAIRKSIEFAEDDMEMAWKTLRRFDITQKDVVVGIAASGSTPYVVHGLKKAQENKIITGCVTCNLKTELVKFADYPIEVIVGPEIIAGSTRMKAGTATKMILNMISTSVMIKLGKILNNNMVDMQLSNNKLIERGTKMLMHLLKIDYKTAQDLLKSKGSVRKAIVHYRNHN